MDKALLVVDVQVGLVARKLHDKERVLATIARAIAGFRKKRDLIVFVQHCAGILKPGTEGWQIDPGVDRRAEDPLIRKVHGDAFQGTQLGLLLEQKAIREVVVCGLVSHGCVRATCLGARSAGLDVRLLKGGHTHWAREAAAKTASVEQALAAQGIPTTSEG